MAVISAAAVQKNRTYVASGFVDDDYILDDKQPTSRSIFGANRIANSATLTAANATAFFGSSVLISSISISEVTGRLIPVAGLLHKLASIISADTRSIFASELKWSLVDATDSTWGDETVTIVTWVDEGATQTTYTKQNAAGSTWNKIVDDERPFG